MMQNNINCSLSGRNICAAIYSQQYIRMYPETIACADGVLQRSGGEVELSLHVDALS